MRSRDRSNGRSASSASHVWSACSRSASGRTDQSSKGNRKSPGGSITWSGWPSSTAPRVELRRAVLRPAAGPVDDLRDVRDPWSGVEVAHRDLDAELLAQPEDGAG